MIKYKRILLKMSGEVLKGSLNGGVDFETALRFAERIKKLKKTWSRNRNRDWRGKYLEIS